MNGNESVSGFKSSEFWLVLIAVMIACVSTFAGDKSLTLSDAYWAVMAYVLGRSGVKVANEIRQSKVDNLKLRMTNGTGPIVRNGNADGGTK